MKKHQAGRLGWIIGRDEDWKTWRGRNDQAAEEERHKLLEAQGMGYIGSKAGGPGDPCTDCPNLPVTGPKGDGVLREVVITGKAPTEPQSKDWLINATIRTHARSDASPKDVSYLYAFADNTPQYLETTVSLMFAVEGVVDIGAWGIKAIAENGAGAAAKGGVSLWPAASGSRTFINGIEYTTHALERMQPVGTIMKGTTIYSRGIPPSVVENAIKFGKVSPGNTAAEVIRTFDNIKVITNPQGTKVITVIKIGN